ncbi:ISAs1 family transposase [bacterium]|nr:ISAs1 family transposase [bacterium]
MQAATTREKGHGRVERRTITTTTWVNAYLTAWPGVAQAFRVERERTAEGVTTVEVVYGITSLTRATAGAARLLGLVRAHWGIENGLHHVRDETPREDRCRVRRGHAPRVLASLRNVAVHLLRNADYPTVASATRAMNARPDLALAMLHAPPSNSA